MFTEAMVPLGAFTMGEHGPISLYNHYGQILAQDGAQLRPATGAEIAELYRPFILGADGLRDSFASVARALAQLAREFPTPRGQGRRREARRAHRRALKRERA